MARSSGRELYIGVTDSAWYEFLAARPGIDEVNFWRPGGGLLRAAQGAPFLFKLKAPHNAIAGLGFFEYAERMTISAAWEFYGEKNGVGSFAGLVSTIGRNHGSTVDGRHEIGCIILSQPMFFTRDRWISQPAEWKANTQQGVYADMDSGYGADLWKTIDAMIGSQMPPLAASAMQPFGGVGKPAIYLPRQGQGTFRRLVLAAYGNRCSVSGERTLPVIEAAHISDFSEERRHEVTNGIALRSDIHKLFDRGYVSVRPDYRFVVSRALAEDFNNGKIYYDLHERAIRLPEDPHAFPNAENLERHYEERFKH